MGEVVVRTPIDVPTRATVAFIASHLLSGGAVLEVGCGEGHVALELLNCGYQVIGVDSDQEVIARAQERGVPAIQASWPEFGGTGRADDPAADQWRPIQRFIGEWTGTASGDAGDGIVTRQYTFIMNGRFVHETNISRYPPQEKNKSGEVHEHWGIFSYDKVRKLLVLRQFHVEGFVTTYRQLSTAEGPASPVFESEAFENFSNSWKARARYEFLSDDEFIETFELAAPGKPFQVYSYNHFKRVQK